MPRNYVSHNAKLGPEVKRPRRPRLAELGYDVGVDLPAFERKEGIASIWAGDSDCTLVTRPLVWPGGRLVINAAARKGFIRARVTDPVRREISGFGLQECAAFTGDAVRHEVKWPSADIKELAGETIRLEFSFRNADIFAFLAQQG